VVGAALLRQFRLVGTSGNHRDLEPHAPGVLHAEMTNAADTDHSDKLTGLRWCVSQSAERREAPHTAAVPHRRQLAPHPVDRSKCSAGT
jgi:hypothetical protein